MKRRKSGNSSSVSTIPFVPSDQAQCGTRYSKKRKLSRSENMSSSSYRSTQYWKSSFLCTTDADTGECFIRFLQFLRTHKVNIRIFDAHSPRFALTVLRLFVDLPECDSERWRQCTHAALKSILIHIRIFSICLTYSCKFKFLSVPVSAAACRT